MATYLTGSEVPEIDEDFPYFLEELGDLLNKYHYGFSQIQFLKFIDPDIKIVEFKGDGKFLYPIATIPKHLMDKGDDSE